MDNPKIFNLPKLRNRVRVFWDRASAGKVLAGMLEEYRNTNATVEFLHGRKDSSPLPEVHSIHKEGV